MSIDDLLVLQSTNSAAYAGNIGEPSRLTNSEYIAELIVHLQSEIDRLLKLVDAPTETRQ